MSVLFRSGQFGSVRFGWSHYHPIFHWWFQPSTFTFQSIQMTIFVGCINIVPMMTILLTIHTNWSNTQVITGVSSHDYITPHINRYHVIINITWEKNKRKTITHSRSLWSCTVWIFGVTGCKKVRTFSVTVGTTSVVSGTDFKEQNKLIFIHLVFITLQYGKVTDRFMREHIST